MYIISKGGLTLVNRGYGFEFFWSNYPEFNEYIVVFILHVTIIFSIVFSIKFLDTSKYAPLAHKGLIGFVFALILSFLGYLFSYFTLIFIWQAITITIFLYLFILSIYIYFKKNKAVRFYILANIFFIIGFVIFILKANQIIPYGFLPFNTYSVGVVLEITFFSLALANKIKILTDTNKTMQEENLTLIKEQNETLETKVKERTNELESASTEILTQNEELQQQQEELIITNEKLEITFKHLQTTSNRLNQSIQYANRIQQVILPEKDKIDSFFSEHFSLYLPKDIVSGDFYWFTLLEDNKAVFVLADCTGHGVPGAFMSMVGGTLLHETIKVKGVIEPARILRNLHAGVRNVLKQKESLNSDGMDISVCLFEKDLINESYQVTFAGAKSSIFYKKDSQIIQLNGDRVSVGGFTKRERIFTNQTFNLKKNDVIYFTSDGYIDQNDIARKRFGSSKFKELLSSIYELPILEQKQAIIDSLKEHQQNEEQRDDISVVGIRL